MKILDIITDLIRQRTAAKQQSCRRLEWNIAQLQAKVNRAKQEKRVPSQQMDR